MEFKILEPVSKVTRKNEFEVVVKVMYGDADGYGEIKLSKFKKGIPFCEEALKDLIGTLERMLKAYPNGRGGYDTYDHIDGFNRWFAGEILDEIEDWWNSLSDEETRIYGQESWPYEPNGYGMQSSIDSYKVYFYNQNGVKCNVKVEL